VAQQAVARENARAKGKAVLFPPTVVQNRPETIDTTHDEVWKSMKQLNSYRVPEAHFNLGSLLPHVKDGDSAAEAFRRSIWGATKRTSCSMSARPLRARGKAIATGPKNVNVHGASLLKVKGCRRAIQAAECYISAGNFDGDSEQGLRHLHSI
jgi:hypothetical protein